MPDVLMKLVPLEQRHFTSEETAALKAGRAPIPDTRPRTERISQIVFLAALTPKIQVSSFTTDEIMPVRPVSVCLLGPKEQGKTETLRRVTSLKWVKEISKWSSRTLEAWLWNNPDITALVVPDMGSVLLGSSATAERSIEFLARICEEGISDVPQTDGSVHSFQLRKAAFLTAAIDRAITKRWAAFEAVSLDTRFLFVDFQLSADEQAGLLNQVLRYDRRALMKFTIALSEKDVVTVKYPEPLQKWLQVNYFPFVNGGPRLVASLQALLLAHAVAAGRRKVDEGDVAFLLRMHDIWNGHAKCVARLKAQAREYAG